MPRPVTTRPRKLSCFQHHVHHPSIAAVQPDFTVVSVPRLFVERGAGILQNPVCVAPVWNSSLKEPEPSDFALSHLFLPPASLSGRSYDRSPAYLETK